MNLVDSHAHLNATLFSDDLAEVLARAHAAGTTRIIVPAISWKSIPYICHLSQTHIGIYAAIGIYPKACAGWQSSDIAQLRPYACQSNVVAIGEIGLDYNWPNTPLLLERLLIETDAPNLPPHPHRGSRNEPAYVRFVAESMAAACGKSVSDFAKITTENALRLFNLA